MNMQQSSPLRRVPAHWPDTIRVTIRRTKYRGRLQWEGFHDFVGDGKHKSFTKIVVNFVPSRATDVMTATVEVSHMAPVAPIVFAYFIREEREDDAKPRTQSPKRRKSRRARTMVQADVSVDPNNFSATLKTAWASAC